MAAEKSAEAHVRSLVYLTADSLILGPPDLFSLGEAWDAAVRPVHIKNVGLGAGRAPDAFWSRVYKAVGVERRAAALDDLVCATYHERSIDPRDVDDIEIGASLRQWIASRIGAGFD